MTYSLSHRHVGNIDEVNYENFFPNQLKIVLARRGVCNKQVTLINSYHVYT